MKKTCDNCEYKYYPENKYPCYCCINNGIERQDHWQTATEVNDDKHYKRNGR